MGCPQSLPSIFSLFKMFPEFNAKTSKGVWAVFVKPRFFFWFSQQQEFIWIVIIFRLLLTKSKKNLGLICKNYFGTVSTYHPSCHKSFSLKIVKAYESEEILNWHCFSLSLNANLCIHFYWLSRLRQASHRKIIQSSALRQRLWRFKILTCPLLKTLLYTIILGICRL